MTLAHQFERIVEGGEVTDRIDMGERVAIACALGGPERRTLFLLSSTDAYPQAPGRHPALAAGRRDWSTLRAPACPDTRRGDT